MGCERVWRGCPVGAGEHGLPGQGWRPLGSRGWSEASGLGPGSQSWLPAGDGAGDSDGGEMQTGQDSDLSPPPLGGQVWPLWVILTPRFFVEFTQNMINVSPVFLKRRISSEPQRRLWESSGMEPGGNQSSDAARNCSPTHEGRAGTGPRGLTFPHSTETRTCIS